MKYSRMDAPSGIADGQLSSYLKVATLCTADLEGYKKFYGEMTQMDVVGPIALSDEEKSKQKAFWNIPDDVDYDLYHFYRSAVPSLIHLRVLHLKKATPHIHKSYSSYEIGSFSLGFPCLDAKAMDLDWRGHGVESMAPMQLGEIVRPGGKKGHYLETIYKGPDYLHVVGIERVGIPPLAPCDPATGIGGPGYSACVARNGDKELAFYTEVLGHYTMYDATWKTSPGSALGIPVGEPYRFIGIYPQGQFQNYLILLEFEEGKAIETGVQSCAPNQGLGMYTYYTSDINEIMKRAQSNEIKVVSKIQSIDDPMMGAGRACVFELDSGFRVEVFEEVKN